MGNFWKPADDGYTTSAVAMNVLMDSDHQEFKKKFAKAKARALRAEDRQAARPKEDHAAIFVYQPPESEDDREIYQKRFHFGMNDLVEKAVGALGGSAGLAVGASVGATVGATVGSIVPV